jgi:anaerobic sulfite reductase subunit A
MEVLRLRLDSNQAEAAFENIAKAYTIIAPKMQIGKGRFSDTDVVTYGNVESLSEIVFDGITLFSAKSVFSPIRETLFSYDNNSSVEAKEICVETQPTIVFLRSCDINAVDVLDAIFLEHGGRRDSYYKGRRECIRFFLLECQSPCASCFCVSMGTNKTETYSVFVRKEENGYGIKIKDEEFLRYFSQGTEAEVEPVFIEEDISPLKIPASVDNSLFGHTMWKEYSGRCIGCGRCTVSCPTCTCFTMQDIIDDEDEGKSERRRIWSSCQIKKFSLLAGNHDFRTTNGDTMRYKVLHKIIDFKKRFGFSMCVGCGRCNEVCPEYISMSKCIDKINAISVGDGET